MKYLVRTVVGLGLMVACATVMAYAVYQLLQIGTCASGGPYQIARECPGGTERLILAFFPAVLVLFGATALYGARGQAPGGEGEGLRVRTWILCWCLIFGGLSFASFWGVWGPDANPGPGGELGGLIVAFLFALMTLGALPFVAGRVRTPAERQAAMERIVGKVTPRSWQPAAPTRPEGDVVSKLERAQRLRDEGALTEAEFQKLKREILP